MKPTNVITILASPQLLKRLNASYVYYDFIQILARQYAQEKHITERGLIVAGIGKGIGAVAAHELGHQGLLTWVNDNSDPNTYDFHSGNREQLYFGNLHWSPAALEKMRDALPH